MSTPITITTSVNGTQHCLTVSPESTLLDLLRDQLGLTGTKSCCGEGECGACTVHVDGVAVNSCLMLAAEADGHSVTTIEGLATSGLSDLQEEFLKHGAVQCGFCIPGQVMNAASLLVSNPHPSEAEVRTAMAGNLCRCSGYSRIVEAILATAARRRKG